MKKFQSHKTVEAAKIIDFEPVPGGARLTVGSAGSAEEFTVDNVWLAKHASSTHILVGGYYVRYADGYTSWSPAEAFETGYTPHNEHTSAEVASIAGHVLRGEPFTDDMAKALAASCLTQAADKGEVIQAGEIQGLPVAGYKPTQPAWAVEAVNVFKELEERTLRHADSLLSADVDRAWLGHGRTHLAWAFMALNRAVFQPGRIDLPEDRTEGEDLFTNV